MFEYPERNSHQLNLDWIISKMVEMQEEIEELQNRVTALEEGGS